MGSEMCIRDSVRDARAEFEVIALWPGPKAVGDGSLYVLRRRDAD